MTLFDDMMAKAAKGEGFLAALDQSGGSTPNALTAYGVPEDVSANTNIKSKQRLYDRDACLSCSFYTLMFLTYPFL